MNRTKAQFARLRILDAEIRNHHYPNCLRFSEDYEVSERTVKRDIEFLRDQLDAPIAYDTGKHGYYYTEGFWFLPFLAVNESVLRALYAAIQLLQGADNGQAKLLVDLRAQLVGGSQEMPQISGNHVSQP